MLRRVAMLVLLIAAFAAPARAGETELMPGVTYDRTVEFTLHGAVVLHVVTAPRPTGLYALAPSLARGVLTGGTEKLTQIERDASAQATAVGIDGDFFDAAGVPRGIVLQNGALAHAPVPARASIGVDGDGTLHVDRVRFFGTWQGTGQRRPLDELNEVPAGGDVALFTPAYGARAPAVPGSADVVLQPFAGTSPGVESASTVVAAGTGGGEAIPANGAVLVASGATAAKLAAEAPLGTSVATRLILQPWSNVTQAVGGGPLLVRNGKPVFRTTEDFTSDEVTARSPRAGVGQLADGRIVLVAVDGDQPGYSVGLTSYELAQALVELGAVTASAVNSGPYAALAFDGELLNRPLGGGRAVKDALLLQYFGVYAPEPAVPLVNGDPGRTEQSVAYTIVRPSTVTAALVGPDGTRHALETSVRHDPGTYTFRYSTFDAEGTWQWQVSATDDLGRVSTAGRAFRYDTTLHGLAVPRSVRGRLPVAFALARTAAVTLRIETPSGVVVRSLTAGRLTAGTHSLTWDGRLSAGTRAFGGSYVARVLATSSVGSSDLAATFVFRRVPAS
jgi:hypothetical protein